MSIETAVRILNAAGHCGASWEVAYDGIGPMAFGRFDRPAVGGIRLSARDAIRLAESYLGAPS